MSFVAVAVAGAAVVGSVAGAVISSNGAKSAANTQASAAQSAAQVQQNMFNTTQANLQPYMSAGNNALAAYQQALGLGAGGSGAGQMNATQFQGSPGYQFQLQQGLSAANNAASARGGVVSGNTLKALQSYGTGLANQDWYNYLGQLSGLSASGQNAAANLGGIATQTGGQIGSDLIGAGNAQAAGQVASANAYGGVVSGIGGIGMNYLMQQGNPYGQTNPYGNPSASDQLTADINASGDAGLGAGTGSVYSDRRLKTDVEEIGKTKNGLPIYLYRMKGDPKTRMGLMADDVEDVAPDAVKKDPKTGYKKVNYLKAVSAKAKRAQMKEAA